MIPGCSDGEAAAEQVAVATALDAAGQPGHERQEQQQQWQLTSRAGLAEQWQENLSRSSTGPWN